LFAAAGIEAVMAGNISGAIENDAPLGQEFRAPRKTGARTLAFGLAAAIGDGEILRASSREIIWELPVR
jgi:hypothetical protein